MKATGIVRRIDPLGRVVIPKELRKIMHIKEDDPIEIFTENDTIILRAYRPDHTDIADRIERIIEDMTAEGTLRDDLLKKLDYVRAELLEEAAEKENAEVPTPRL